MLVPFVVFLFRDPRHEIRPVFASAECIVAGKSIFRAEDRSWGLIDRTSQFFLLGTRVPRVDQRIINAFKLLAETREPSITRFYGYRCVVDEEGERGGWEGGREGGT